jgi:hypothetical protein
MTIEFHTQYAKVKDKLIEDVRTEIMKMAQSDEQISRAEIILKEDKSFIPAENKTCEIRLVIFGSDLMSYRRTNNFNNAAKGAIKELKELVNEEVKKSKEPPDVLTSTVKV